MDTAAKQDILFGTIKKCTFMILHIVMRNTFLCYRPCFRVFVAAMVFFTCAHCGESLKKSKVEKHYQTFCSRNPVAVTCVDCCKDFRYW
jgi:transcription initiation factor IIE alpha subunit